MDPMRSRPPWEINDDPPAQTVPFLASEPYTGPATGDQLAVLEAEMRTAGTALPPAPAAPYTGPATGDHLSAFAVLERIADQQASAAATAVIPKAQTIPFERNTDASPGRIVHSGAAAGHRRSRRARGRSAGDQAAVAAAHNPLGRLSAGYSPFRSAVVLTLTLAGLALVAWHHAGDVAGRDPLAWTWVALSAMMAVVQVLAWLDRPKQVTPAEAVALDLLRVTVNVPVYNEDPAALRLVARALARQTRLPQRVEFVDDGSDQFTYEDVRAELTRLTRACPAVEWRWIRTERTPASGKRAAQAVTIQGDSTADVFATLDSDTILDPRAIEEGLKPFADPRVQSVAAVLLVYNSSRNLVAALTEIWLAVYQLGIRAAWSALGRVMVNSGGLAFYRAGLLRDALPAYLGETFAGQQVSYSDDAMLTFFATLRGRTVQQPTSFAFTIMPEKVGHHIRQQLRWMRGNVIRSFWWFRYLSPFRLGWWLGYLAWAEFTLTTVLLIAISGLDAAHGARHPAALPGQLLPTLPVLAGLSYLVSLRAMLIRRRDQRTAARLAAFACSPLITVWSMTVLRVLRFWAIATCMRSGWGTRGKVEVTLSGGAP